MGNMFSYNLAPTWLILEGLAGERSQSAAENKTASERTFVRFFSTKRRSLRITVGRWLPKETLIRSAPRLGGIYLIPITRRGSPWWGVRYLNSFCSGKNEMHRGPSFFFAACSQIYGFPGRVVGWQWKRLAKKSSGERKIIPFFGCEQRFLLCGVFPLTYSLNAERCDFT